MVDRWMFHNVSTVYTKVTTALFARFVLVYAYC